MNEYIYGTMKEFLATSEDVTSIDGVISIIDLGMTIRYDKVFDRWVLLKSTPVTTLLREKCNKIEVEYINNFLNSYVVSDMLRSYLKAIQRDVIAFKQSVTDINNAMIAAQRIHTAAPEQIYDKKQQLSRNTVHRIPGEITAPILININNQTITLNRYAKILTNDDVVKVSNKLHSVVVSGVLFDFSKLKTHGLYNTESNLISLLKFIFNRLTSEYKIDYTTHYLYRHENSGTFTVNVKDKIHKWDCENMYILEETDTIYINSHELINAIRKIHDIIETTKSSNHTEPKQTYIRRQFFWFL